MIRSVTAVTLAAALVAVAAAPAAAQQPDRNFQRYGKVRDQVLACAIDRAANTLGAERRRRCPRLRRRYALYSWYGAVSRTFIICKTRRCPPAVDGLPNPRGRPPGNAVRVYG